MKTQWYVVAVVILALASLAQSARSAEPIESTREARERVRDGAEDMPTEIRTDVARIFPLGEKFDRKHIASTCTDKTITRFKCFKSTYDKIIKEREPTVTGYVLLLSIGAVVLAEERQKILDAARAESDTEGDLQRNTLDTAELLIDTLERVAKKAHVIKQEKPIVENLRTTLISRAESVLKTPVNGRTIASIGAVPPKSDNRRENLLQRLSGLSEVTQ